MHEKAITEKLIEDILLNVKDSTFTAIKRVVVDVGTLTSYESTPIRHYFNLLKVDHELLKDAEIRVSMVDGEEIMLRELEVE